MRRLVLTALTALLLVSTASASELGVQGIEFDSPVYGGETVEKDFTISWSGETDTVAHINASIEGGSPDGVNLSLPENPVIVPADGEKDATLLLAADYFVRPENLSINVEASTDVETETEVEYRDSESGDGRTIVIDSDEGQGQEEEEGDESEEGNNTKINRLRERLNQSDSENERLRDRIESLEDNSSENNNQSDNSNQDENIEDQNLYLLLVLALALIGCIVYIVFFYIEESDENGDESYEFKVNK